MAEFVRRIYEYLSAGQPSVFENLQVNNLAVTSMESSWPKTLDDLGYKYGGVAQPFSVASLETSLDLPNQLKGLFSLRETTTQHSEEANPIQNSS